MTSISEFERTKPRKTMLKLKVVIDNVYQRASHAETHSEQIFLADLHKLLVETRQSLEKGE